MVQTTNEEIGSESYSGMHNPPVAGSSPARPTPFELWKLIPGFPEYEASSK